MHCSAFFKQVENQVSQLIPYFTRHFIHWPLITPHFLKVAPELNTLSISVMDVGQSFTSFTAALFACGYYIASFVSEAGLM